MLTCRPFRNAHETCFPLHARGHQLTPTSETLSVQFRLLLRRALPRLSTVRLPDKALRPQILL